jgi:hypothetical protein
VKLTHEQLSRTARALLPSVADFASGLPRYGRGDNGFTNESGHPRLSLPDVEAHFEAAGKLADALLARPAAIDACMTSAAADRACVDKGLRALGRKAFRRPLADAEVAELVAFWAQESGGLGPQAGLRQVLRRMLLSPHFLFRTELGAGSGAAAALTPHEAASALAYTLLDGPPDVELATAADRGELGTKAQLEGQVRRLLARAETAPGVRKLMHELFSTASVAGAVKDAVFKGFNEGVALAMKEEAERFLDQVLWTEDRRFATLVTAPWSVLGDTAARFYGVPGWTAVGTRGSRVHTFSDQKRAGVLTLGGLMTTLAAANDTDAVKRGHFVRSQILCQDMPPPPPGLNPILPEPDGKRTQRERLAQHSADPGCATCHRLMDPIGYALESYDGVGRYRATDVGRPLDTRGELAGVAGEPRFADAAELGRLLANAPEAQACMVRTFFRYAHARTDAPADACALRALERRFAASGGDLLELVVGVLTADDFLQRRGD